jgi:hypothetical protein
MRPPGNFTQVPNELIDDAGLSAGAFRLYVRLLRMPRVKKGPEAGMTPATLTQLAEGLYGEKHVRKTLLPELYAAGLVERPRQGRAGRPSLYICRVFVEHKSVVDLRFEPDPGTRLDERPQHVTEPGVEARLEAATQRDHDARPETPSRAWGAL